MSPHLIVIGASAGGVTAIRTLLHHLPETFRVPILVVQHLPADAQIDPKLVFHFAGHEIAEARDKLPIEARSVYFAPPGYHTLVERELTLALSQDEPLHHARPAIDVTFESAALALGERLCGVLLTGANADGALGLLEIANSGGTVMVQCLEEAEVPMMPAAALKLLTPNVTGDLKTIARALVQLTEAGP